MVARRIRIGTNAPSYTGIADIVTLSAFYGLRAAGSAYVETPAVRLIRTDTTEADISTLADGSLNTADAFFNASAYKVVTLYDQLNGAYGDMVPTSVPAGRPTFTLSGLNGLPTIDFSTTTDLKSFSGPSPTAQPVFYAAVAKRGTNGAIYNYAVADANNSHMRWQASIANTMQLAAGGSPIGLTASDSTFHAMAGVFNGASSAARNEGDSDTGSAGTADFYSGIALNWTALAPDDIRMTEAAFGLSDVTADLPALVDNMEDYWGPF